MNMTKSEILNTMKLLDIKEVTTPRQALNGTREFELPIKYPWGKKIRVASFKTGYVRNQNGCSSNYQLNKVKKTSKFHKYTNQHNGYYKIDHYERILIPNELDRLEYLVKFAVKNYYIKPVIKTKTEEKRVLQDISVTIDCQRHTLQTQETLKI